MREYNGGQLDLFSDEEWRKVFKLVKKSSIQIFLSIQRLSEPRETPGNYRLGNRSSLLESHQIQQHRNNSQKNKTKILHWILRNGYTLFLGNDTPISSDRSKSIYDHRCFSDTIRNATVNVLKNNDFSLKNRRPLVGAFFVLKIWKIGKKKAVRDDRVDFGTLDFGRQCIPLFFCAFAHGISKFASARGGFCFDSNSN